MVSQPTVPLIRLKFKLNLNAYKWRHVMYCYILCFVSYQFTRFLCVKSLKQSHSINRYIINEQFPFLIDEVKIHRKRFL